MPRHGPQEKLPFTDGRFDALASRLLGGLGVQLGGGVVYTLSALEANE